MSLSFSPPLKRDGKKLNAGAVCSRVQTPPVCKTPQHRAIPRGLPGGDLSPVSLQLTRKEV